jgi:hypothetical protein
MSTSPANTTTTTTTKYQTFSIKSWHAYQQVTPSHLHSIEHYYANCKELAKGSPKYVMVLRDEVIRITGWRWTTGWSAQNCADTNGYVDVRTGKKYPYGTSSFYDDINIK